MRMRYFVMGAIAAATLAGCKTLDPGPSSTIALIESEPAEALVTVEGFGECTTPCTVEIDKPRLVTVAKAGFLAKRFHLTPDRKRVLIKLDLAAPTGDVDAEEMPDL